MQSPARLLLLAAALVGVGATSVDVQEEEYVTVERTVVECENGSRWREACNWCVCEGGRRTCTEADCSGWSEAKAAEDGIIECHENSRWKKDCNWCSCANGRGVCTLMACSIRFKGEGSECDGYTIWVSYDCNTCICLNGVASCKKSTCAVTPPPQVSTSPVPPREPECQGDGPGDRWRKDCNWCRCRNGVGACTKRLCRGGVRDDEPQCEGNVAWKDDCNTCRCVNGTAVCTKVFCGPVPVRPAIQRAGVRGEPECQGDGPGDRWRQDCNWCRCRNGVGTCSKMACVEDARVEGPECEGNVSWKKDCNRCTCANGTAVCTLALCGPLPPRPAPRTEATKPECEGGEEDFWTDNCNRCRCVNGIPRCTKRLCRGNEDPTPTCSGSPSWKDDCNTCRCNDGTPVCTTKFCGPLPPRPAPRTEATKPECEGGEEDFWTDNCNRCRCVNGIPRCTKRLCRGNEDPTPTCSGNPSWKNDCNTCNCNNGQPVCTTQFCGNLEEPQTGVTRVSLVRQSPAAAAAECVDGSRWRRDCNWCSCINGGAACTKKRCRDAPTLRKEPECEGNSTWKDDCNWCTCGDGLALCTRMACLKKTNELCSEGSSWKDDCNICRCSNGFVLCTKRACVKREELSCVGTLEGGECVRKLPPLCFLPPVNIQNQCSAVIFKWSYVEEEGECVQLMYGGCEGTENLFDTQAECEAVCPPHPKERRITPVTSPFYIGEERCTLPADEGPCMASFRRYAYNAHLGRCEEFLYGGCLGNANNFGTEEECLAKCRETRVCDRSRCPWNMWGHYLAKECVPQYTSDACCPSSFQCPSASESGKDETKCYYNSVAYNPGDSVPVTDPCSAGCFCDPHSEPDSLPLITCASVECPELFRPPTPGCRPLYRADQCCPYDYECVDPEAPPFESRAATCDWQNKTYLEGSKIYFDDNRCRSCICGADFSGPDGPGCFDIDCGFTFRYSSQYHRGCTPIRFEDNGCCPIDFMCPDDSRIEQQQQQQQQPGTGDESAVCRLGDLKFAVGASMAVTECKLKCLCVTPPELTCIQYRSCEALEEAQKECPPVKCESGCLPVVDSPGGCPRCECSNNTFTCPAQTCPSTCRPEVDLQTGCPSCKCQCPPEVPCPADCLTQTVMDEATGCPRCECQPGSSQQPRAECPEYPGGIVPCPMDCAVIKTVDENGCQVCKCDPNNPGNPFGPSGPPPPPKDGSSCPPLINGQPLCPMDCAVIKTVDENGCQVCRCDPDNPGGPFGPFGPPPPPRDGASCPPLINGQPPCPMDCAVIKTTDENGCQVCRCDPDNPGNPFVPFVPSRRLVRQSCPGAGEAPCPFDCAIKRFMDENGCERCICDPDNVVNPFVPYFLPPQ